ncbi:MAG: hypothetical protein AAF572_18205 [Cyanobacteria bacterium P01_B01_bin.77]
MGINRKSQGDKFNAVIWTEGKTDWQHLKAAMRALGLELNIRFNESSEDIGYDNLKKQCETAAKFNHNEAQIFIFDRDIPKILKDICHPDKEYKDWGNNVFSFAIPVPSHRKKHENLCIEFYYSDTELATFDANGRRLYTTSEFNEKSGKYKSNPEISIGNKGKLRGYSDEKRSKIVDQEIYNAADQNIALSKANFAENILNSVPPFNNFDFDEFRQIFDVVIEIINSLHSRNNIFVGNLTEFDTQMSEFTSGQKVVYTADKLIKTLKLFCTVFIATVIRHYENDILTETPNYKKKSNQLSRFFQKALKNQPY